MSLVVDVAEDVSVQNRPGDFLVTLDSTALPGQNVRIAIEAKDAALPLSECERVLAASRVQWEAHASLIVFHREEQTPFSSPIAIRKLQQGHLCVLNRDLPVPAVLQAAYQIVRLDAVRSLQRTIGHVDLAIIQGKLEQAAQKLCEFSNFKAKVTALMSGLNDLRGFANRLKCELQQNLEEAWDGLGIKAPMPALPHEDV